jgi:hypothetical protein
MDQKSFLRKNQTKGIAYSLEEFAEKHGLGSEMAEDLFYRFGPSSIDLDLDLLMAAKSKRRREPPFVGE